MSATQTPRIDARRRQTGDLVQQYYVGEGPHHGEHTPVPAYRGPLRANRRLHSIVAEMKRRIRRELDNLVVITGGEGVGKSTLAIQLARILDPRFRPDEPDHCAFTSTEFIQSAKTYGLQGENRALLLDEAFNGAFSRDFNRRENKTFMKFLGIGRALCHHYVLCFPRLHNLDDYIRNHRLTYEIRIPERGKAVIYKPNPSEWSDDDAWMEWSGQFRFDALDPAKDPEYAAYKKRKHEYVLDMTQTMLDDL